jgi:3-oxoadipate enol-lactonase
MPYALVGGARIWYRLDGNRTGDPMILMGGSLWGRNNLTTLIEPLGLRYQLLTFDPRGYGRSGSEGITGATIETWADDAAGLIDAIGWRAAHVHGVSFGGTVALSLAIRHPECCLSVVANACSARADAERTRRYQSWIDAALASGVGHSLVEIMIPADTAREPRARRWAIERSLQMAAGTPPATWVAANRALQNVDLEAGLRTCQVPALLIAGELDEMTPVRQKPPGLGMDQIVELMPQARLIVLKDVGHETVFQRTDDHVRFTVQFIECLTQSGPVSCSPISFSRPPRS